MGTHQQTGLAQQAEASRPPPQMSGSREEGRAAKQKEILPQTQQLVEGYLGAGLEEEL